LSTSTRQKSSFKSQGRLWHAWLADRQTSYRQARKHFYGMIHFFTQLEGRSRRWDARSVLPMSRRNYFLFSCPVFLLAHTGLKRWVKDNQKILCDLLSSCAVANKILIGKGGSELNLLWGHESFPNEEREWGLPKKVMSFETSTLMLLFKGQKENSSKENQVLNKLHKKSSVSIPDKAVFLQFIEDHHVLFL